MSCTCSKSKLTQEQFHDRVDDRGALCLGAWRWVEPCADCGQFALTQLQKDSDLAESSIPADGPSRVHMF